MTTEGTRRIVRGPVVARIVVDDELYHRFRDRLLELGMPWDDATREVLDMARAGEARGLAHISSMVYEEIARGLLAPPTPPQPPPPGPPGPPEPPRPPRDRPVSS